MRILLAPAVLLSCLIVSGCEDAQALKVQETTQKLTGTWLREMEIGGSKGRRILVLGPDGKFAETLVVEFPDGRKGRETKEGEWSYDGVNLKRRYTHEDGRQLSGNFNFGTHALTKFDGREFEARNHAAGDEIHYRKVPDGTLP